MSNPAAILFDFALESLPNASLARQAQVYRAMAELSADSTQRATLTAEAEACDRMIADQLAHARRHQQLVLNFPRRAEG